MLDDTHDLKLQTWVRGAQGHREFPIQNLPLCVIASPGNQASGGVAIGEWIVDLHALAESGVLSGSALDVVRVAAKPTLNGYMASNAERRTLLRQTVSKLLRSDAAPDTQSRLRDCLLATDQVTLALPATIGDYSDFFAGIHHAKTAGKMFRPDNPLLPNYKHVPIAYHGRASSIRVSGHPVCRPTGQRVEHGSTDPTVEPSQRLDFELELGIWVQGGNALGTSIPIAAAADHIVGFCLLNDWSARDIQAWETQPLGPFLGKNFLTTISPFVITAQALEPFRTRQAPRAPEDPTALPYLVSADDQATGAFDIKLEVTLSTQRMREANLAPLRITRASALDLYWTPAQMIAHHTSNGCDLRPGDLFGSGTVSAASSDGHGSLLEMTSAGRNPITLPSGETRKFLEAGDEVILTAWCERDGFARIGFGEARGRVVDHPIAT